MGWVRPPADVDAQRGQAQNLLRWSRPAREQPWTLFHIKDTNSGAMVREVRSMPFWMKRGDRVVGPYWLIAARDPIDRQGVKYFLSNASAGVPLEVVLHVAFSRWPVERCLQDEKSELGLSHFEVRKYEGVLRHLRITQVSHLFLARQTLRLAEKKSAGDDLPGARRDPGVARRAAAERGRSKAAIGQNRHDSAAHPGTQRGRSRLPCQDSSAPITKARHSRRETTLLHPAAQRIAL